MNAVHFSSERQDWGTPQPFFDALNAEFGFTLDACALPHNAKCETYWSPDDDALLMPWDGVVWMNPPYGHGIGAWIKKAYEVSQNGAVVVALIPAKTETAWWHRYVMHAAEIRLIRGRIKFVAGDPDADLRGHGINAPFPSAVVVFRQGNHVPLFSAMDRYEGAAT